MCHFIILYLLCPFIDTSPSFFTLLWDTISPQNLALWSKNDYLFETKQNRKQKTKPCSRSLPLKPQFKTPKKTKVNIDHIVLMTQPPHIQYKAALSRNMKNCNKSEFKGKLCVSYTRTSQVLGCYLGSEYFQTYFPTRH